MIEDLLKFKCEKCGKFANELFYCSECWNVVCEECYDHFVGTCKLCVLELFKGNRRQPSKLIDTEINTETDSLSEEDSPWILFEQDTFEDDNVESEWSGVIDNVERLLEEKVSRRGWC